jgi:hypothetical protein
VRIALDYDDTYTADKELWDEFIDAAIRRGHSVTIVTFRHGGGGMYDGVLYDNLDVEDDAKRLCIPIVYTNGKQKKHCFDADIWIDDNPHLVASYREMKGMALGCEVNGDLG